MRTLLCVAFCLLVFGSAAFTQEQKEPPTVRDYCVKAAHGKGMELESYVSYYVVPLNQARADAGEIAWFLFVGGVVPAGSSAPCDYRFVYGYKGLPPENPSQDQIEAAIKRAKLVTNAPAMAAQRNALSQLVSVDIWYQIDFTGLGAQKGSYIRLNHYSVKPGGTEDWQHLETTYWKPLVEAWDKEGGKGSWGVYGLMMPEGDNLPYNALTVDIFPDWNSMLHEVPIALWSKVHPNTEVTDVFDRLERVRSRHDIETYKVLEVVGPKTASN